MPQMNEQALNHVRYHLASEYGINLNAMTKNDKLFLISILSGGINILEVYPEFEGYTLIKYIKDCTNINLSSIRPLMPALEKFDVYDTKSIEIFLLVLAVSL